MVRSDATLARETPPGHVDSRFRGNDMADLPAWGSCISDGPAGAGRLIRRESRRRAGFWDGFRKGAL